jgi:hypothetical protein
MAHIEDLLAEYLDWKGYLVKRNFKVGRLKHGGWEMELDVMAYHPITNDLVHYEPSLDADAWTQREKRYHKKFVAGRKYILSDVFKWLPKRTKIRQIAVFNSHPANRNEIAGGTIQSVDELMAEIRTDIMRQGLMAKKAIPEQFPRLRTLQLSHCGYYKLVDDGKNFRGQ